LSNARLAMSKHCITAAYAIELAKCTGNLITHLRNKSPVFPSLATQITYAIS